MDTRARRAQLPLPGGPVGVSVRLHTLRTGERRNRGRFGRSEVHWQAVLAHLIEHPGAEGPILVDCGLHPSVAHDPAQNLGRAVARRIEVRMEREEALDEQLRRRGIAAEAVRVVLMSHLHPEQASGASQFPNATFLVDRREWAAAAAGEAPYHGRHVDYPFDWRTIDYGEASIDAFATFGRSVDVFGDGSVRLLSTPGHSAGHTSVLIRTKGREALLVGDAAATRAELEGEPPADRPVDAHLHRRSRSELARFVEQTPSALVVCGREPPAGDG